MAEEGQVEAKASEDRGSMAGRRALELGSRLPVLYRMPLTTVPSIKNMDVILGTFLTTEAHIMHTARLAFSVFTKPGNWSISCHVLI